MCSKVLNGHIILTDTSITTILAPEMTYTPLNKANEQRNYRIFEEFATDSSDAKEQKNNITFTERFRDLP